MNGPGATEREIINGAVRQEYFQLSHDLAVLTRCFGIDLPPDLERDAAALTFAIECADRLLDGIPEPDRRARFCAEVMACLRGDVVSAHDLTPELAGWLVRLREIGGRRHIHERWCEIIRELLRNSERLRTASDHRRFLACAIREGRLMVGLLLWVLAEVSTPRFERFMRLLSEPANLADKLRDARRDFQNGEIAVRPTWRFRARLFFELLKRTVRLAPFSFGNWRLVDWGVRSLFSELVWFRHARSADSHVRGFSLM